MTLRIRVFNCVAVHVTTPRESTLITNVTRARPLPCRKTLSLPLFKKKPEEELRTERISLGNTVVHPGSML
jgi:hypothetical protein